MLVWTLVALFCSGLGVVLATLLGVLALWDAHRLLALGIPAILFILGASASQIFSSRGTVGLLRPPRPLVAASILFTVRRTLPIEYPAAPAATRAANRGLRHERSLKGDNTNDRDAPKTRFGPA